MSIMCSYINFNLDIALVFHYSLTKNIMIFFLEAIFVLSC